MTQFGRRNRLTIVTICILCMLGWWVYFQPPVPTTNLIRIIPQESSVPVHYSTSRINVQYNAGPTRTSDILEHTLEYQVNVPEKRSEPPVTDISTLEQDDPKLVQHLKTNFLVPPSTEPYNLNNPKSDNNPTQHGQNIVVMKILQRKTNGFFIECGALDGELYSNTLYLERILGWTGLLIEAEGKNFREMASKNRKSWISHTCLSPTTKAEKLTLRGLDYNHKNGGGLTLMRDSKPLENFEGYIGAKHPSEEVQCFPLYTYLLALGVTEVDYFSLDIEGGDFEVLKTIPFDKIIFRILEVEVAWVNEGKEVVRSFLEDRGYIFVKEIVVDYIFIHNSVQLPEGLRL